MNINHKNITLVRDGCLFWSGTRWVSEYPDSAQMTIGAARKERKRLIATCDGSIRLMANYINEEKEVA
jgi:hypothetical protein